MKTLIIVLVLAIFPLSASASQGVHHDNNENYSCSTDGKPGNVGYVKTSKIDLVGNGILKLRWKDSLKAHDVQVSMNGRILKTADDGKLTVTGLVGKQSVKVRGVSNCGKGKWSKEYKFLP